MVRHLPRCRRAESHPTNGRIVILVEAQNALFTQAAITLFLIAMGSLVGASFGSFFAAAIERSHRGQNIAWPPSMCTHCERRLEIWENIPVLSYMMLRARCRTCYAPIDPATYHFEVAGLIVGGVIVYFIELHYLLN